MPSSPIRSVAVPSSAPPYDDAGTASARVRRLPLPPRLPDDCRLESAGLTEQLPDGLWPSRFAQVLAETLAGSRPQKQLAPWTTDQARKRISQLSTSLATAHRPRLKRVIVRSPADGVVEMAVILWLGTRACALAVRLERDPAPESPAAGQEAPSAESSRARPEGGQGQPARWYCTAIEAV